MCFNLHEIYKYSNLDLDCITGTRVENTDADNWSTNLILIK